MVGSLFSKIKEASVFGTLLVNLKRELYVLKSPLLTGVAGLQNTTSKLSKRFHNFLKVLRNLRKIPRKQSVMGLVIVNLQTYKFQL